MTLSLPFSPISGVDVGQSMENICQPFEQQGRWPFGADLNADLSAYTRQRPLAMPGGVGVYSSNMAEVVRYVPGELIEKNAFHLELKLTLGQRDQEIVALNEANIAQKKEFDDLKARYETLDGMHRMTMEQFASEYHELKAASGNGPKPLTLVGVLPLPKIKTREACPEIVQWNRDVYLRSTAKAKAQKRGETDRNAITVKKKAKAGRPPKTADDIDDDSHGHLYLENLDGTLISTASLRKLSSKARSVWFTLADHSEAPPTWGKVSDVAGEYYFRRVLNEPGLEFLQYCDDGLWKLREWTQQSYSGWARNHGIRGSQPRQKDAQEGLEEGGLDDPKLIRISPDKEDDDINGNWGGEGHQATDNADNEENDNNDKNTHDEGAETSDGNSTPIPVHHTFPPHVFNSVYYLGSKSPSVVKFSRCKPFVIHAFDILVLVTNSHPSPSAPAPSTTATSGAINALTAGSSASTVPREVTVAADGEATDATRASDSDAPTATPSALDDTSPSTSTHPRLTLKLGPRPRPLTTVTASVAPAEGNISDTPPSSGSGSAAGPSRPSNQGPETTPTETDVVNIRLERTRLGANNEKKRKPDNKTPSASTKKQKTSSDISICTGCLTGVVPPGAWWCHLVQPIKLAIWQLHKPCLILQKVFYTAMTSKQDKFRKSRKSYKSKY
ncbi:hypothetical protein EDB89DRAFT_1910207 [Lactarius sanguifluus]|nr:hypothetical protein EDB89DRAFT_1910207 [Lactarius sanguifluus]